MNTPIPDHLSDFWNAFAKATGGVDAARFYEVCIFGDSEDLANELPNLCFTAPSVQQRDQSGPAKRREGEFPYRATSVSSRTGRASRCASLKLKRSRSCLSAKSAPSLPPRKEKEMVSCRSGGRHIDNTSPENAPEQAASLLKACSSPASDSRLSTVLQPMRPNRSFERTPLSKTRSAAQLQR